LIFMRHIENPENIARQASLAGLFHERSLWSVPATMPRTSLKKCAISSVDAASATPIDLRKPIEQMFIDWLRHQRRQSRSSPEPPVDRVTWYAGAACRMFRPPF